MGVFNDVVKALIAFPSRGVFGGVQPPKWMTGVERGPHYVADHPTGQATTATRLYYYPIYFDAPVSLAGCRTFNSSAGDNGETYRVGMYTESSNGGPGTLITDFGQTTLTAAAAVRTLVESCAIPSPGWYYAAIHFNTACSMYSYGAVVDPSATSVGFLFGTNARLIGSLSTIGFADPEVPFAFYVDTAYGALASTAVAPTASVMKAPAIRFYK